MASTRTKIPLKCESRITELLFAQSKANELCRSFGNSGWLGLFGSGGKQCQEASSRVLELVKECEEYSLRRYLNGVQPN